MVHTVSGSSDNKVHSAVQRQTIAAGYLIHSLPLPVNVDGEIKTEPANWYLHHGDAIADDKDQLDLAIKINHMILLNGLDTSNMSLLVVGKSLGAVLAWATFMNHKDMVFSNFCRVALVLIDPHGAADDDDCNYVYDAGDPLYWPASYPTDTRRFRVYHIFQQEDAPTGAAFQKQISNEWAKEERVCRYEDLTERNGINHNEMFKQPETNALIKEAFEFAWYGDEWWCEEEVNRCDYQ